MIERLKTTTLACLLLATPLPLAGQDESARERWQRVPDVFEALEVKPGTRIADIGAGGGFFTARLSRAVGTEGRVYAVDVDTDVIGRLRERAAGEQWANVEIIHSAQDDPRLPAATLDAALVMNAYHEFTDADAMLRGLARALKPGGRLVLIDQIPAERRRRDARDALERAHTLGSWFAVQDLVIAGYHITRLEDPFIPASASGGGGESGWWMLVAERP